MGKHSNDITLPEAKRFRWDEDDMPHDNAPFAWVAPGSPGMSTVTSDLPTADIAKSLDPGIICLNPLAITSTDSSMPCPSVGLLDTSDASHWCPESVNHTTITDTTAVGVKLDVQMEFGADNPHQALERAPMAEQELVCFGMICDISAMYEGRGGKKLAPSLEVRLKSPSYFISETHGLFKGRIASEHHPLIEGLLDENTLRLHVICKLKQHHTPKKKGKLEPILPCSLDITVYGPLDLFEEIGEWFQGHEVYLQDPDSCHLEVRYCNPQRLSSDNPSKFPMISEIISKSWRVVPKELKELPEPSDFLDILSGQAELEETPQPSAIRSVLKRHQKQALTFMLNREQGWGFDHGRPDVWEIRHTDQGRTFINTVSRSHQQQEPPQFYGGIIADPMGFGKTLTMISLIATDVDAEKNTNTHIEEIESNTGKQDVPTTLVIIPPPILGTWEKQLNDHVTEGALVARRHHGKTRLMETDDLVTVNMVLTTYHTVAAEWKADKGSRKSPLFSVRWKRIILDEAHYIRTGNSGMAKSVCALESISRWAVTGTPIQNRLSDLASLLKFIRVHPYEDPRCFEEDIARPWKAGYDEGAQKRLKRLSSCLLLRRAKDTINLPPRHNLIQAIEFTTEKRTAYERIRQQTIARIDEAIIDETMANQSHHYVNVLQQIESLRLFSNLGLYYDSRHSNASKGTQEVEEWSKVAQRTFNSQRDMSVSIKCLQCASPLGLTDTLLDDTTPKATMAKYTNCLKFVCSECVHKLTSFGSSVPCGHNPTCQSAPVSTSSIALEEVDSPASHQLQIAAIAPPSKIRNLVDGIMSHPPNTKCVVFSTWRLTLDIIKVALDHKGIQNIRFDGKVPQKDRQSVVEKFEADPSIRVMLLTLSCGAVGLTLTAASQAYLMEPHWNPTLEEQALARIHRLGQTREVTTIRLYMRDSFEEEVMKVQDSKKQLARVLLSPHDNGDSDKSLTGLERLRSLL